MSKRAVYDGTGSLTGAVRPADGPADPETGIDPAPDVDGPQDVTEPPPDTTGDPDVPPPAADTETEVARPRQDAVKAEWVAYAEALGVDVPDDATKAQIIDLATAAGG